MIGCPGSPAARRMPSHTVDEEDEYRPCHSGGRWPIALAAVAVIAWVAFIVLLALFVTTSTA
ncbi:MAG: hypothetical protein QOI89_1198 [Solirubrobacteraceae bacterium]|nr:hypothetical protein [Solirubrobacteraceae bacterium]